MSHLLKFRKGWQSEHLARYILSKFSFISEPANISDDLGSDFFCTIFSISQKIYLLPQNSFAIQIKSNKRKIKISNKFNYLSSIELPYYVGVINRNKNTISIYSGEAITHFFSLYGIPGFQSNEGAGYIKLVEEINEDGLHHIIGNDYYMNFPKILELSSDFDYEKDSDKINEFINNISTIQKNISSRKSSEYIFESATNNQVSIYAGSGSSEVFRMNFWKRLCEAFYNVEWLVNNRGENLKDEFIIYEETFLKLQKLHDYIPNYLEEMYKGVKKRLNY